jgi:hypothetical protein
VTGINAADVRDREIPYLGAVYTCDFAYEWVDAIRFTSCCPRYSKLIYDLFMPKCVDIALKWVSEKELDPYLACK